MQLLRVLLHRLRVQHLPVVLADVEVLVVVLGQHDLLGVVAELEVRNVVLRLDHLSALLLVLPLLLQLLRRLLGLAREVLCADLARQDAGLGPVVVLDTQRHLRQDELYFFPPRHGPERFHLQLAQDLRRRLDVALCPLDVREDLGHARPLHFHENLALRHGPKRLDDRQLDVHVGRVV